MQSSWIFVLNLAATWYMVGLIWMVQIVHYPLFDRVGEPGFKRYEADHNRLITPIVGLPMLIEIATAFALLAYAPTGFPSWAAMLGVGLLGMIWLSTALIQVPCHSQLAGGFDESVHRRLVMSNWIRTLAWSARGLLVGYFALKLIQR